MPSIKGSLTRNAPNRLDGFFYAREGQEQSVSIRFLALVDDKELEDFGMLDATIMYNRSSDVQVQGERTYSAKIGQKCTLTIDNGVTVEGNLDKPFSPGVAFKGRLVWLA